MPVLNVKQFDDQTVKLIVRSDAENLFFKFLEVILQENIDGLQFLVILTR
jgi:hypothetical protein